MANVYFVRHAEKILTDDNPDLLDSGDPDLTKVGEYQAALLGDLLDPLGVARIVTSRTFRTFRTGGLASYGVGIPLSVDGRFDEVRWGSVAGQDKRKVLPRQAPVDGPLRGLDWIPNPDSDFPAEAPVQAARRQLEALDECDQEGLMVIGHGFAIKSLFAYCLGWNRQQMIDFPLPHGSVHSFDPSEPRWPQKLYVPPMPDQAVEEFERAA